MTVAETFQTQGECENCYIRVVGYNAMVTDTLTGEKSFLSVWLDSAGHENCPDGKPHIHHPLPR